MYLHLDSVHLYIHVHVFMTSRYHRSQSLPKVPKSPFFTLKIRLSYLAHNTHTVQVKYRKKETLKKAQNNKIANVAGSV